MKKRKKYFKGLDKLSKRKDNDDWEFSYARKLELEYINSLSQKDLFDYIKQREREEFLENI